VKRETYYYMAVYGRNYILFAIYMQLFGSLYNGMYKSGNCMLCEQIMVKSYVLLTHPISLLILLLSVLWYISIFLHFFFTTLYYTTVSINQTLVGFRNCMFLL